jgi:hypothetical protein
MASGNKGDFYDLNNDFQLLTAFEKRAVMENALNLLKVQKAGGENIEPYDLSNDFNILPDAEKWEVLKTAKYLLKLQKNNALLADAPPASPLPMEAEK